MLKSRSTSSRPGRACSPSVTTAARTTRGCSPDWIRQLYRFAIQQDITFFFKTPLKVALSRILDGRPKLKYHEAGMDLNLSSDIYESFEIFQSRILAQYLAMIKPYNFTVIDAERSIEAQQKEVRRIVAEKIDLPSFKWKIKR